MNKVKINILVPFYTYEADIHRYKLTEKIFKHYKNVEQYFKDIAIFSFTMVGSEKDVSKILTLKYFKESEYFEFDQTDPKFNNDLLIMLTEKFKYGMQLSAKTDADILLLAGSNDYISYDFFKQVIEYYNPEKPQLFGIDNYYNGNNAVYMVYYDGMIDNFQYDNSFWWDGLSPHYGREKYKYCGGIIGINRTSIELYDDIIENYTFDEGQIEEFILSKPNMDKFTSK